MNDIGDDVALSTTITVNGTLTNPATVVLTVTRPDATTVTPAVSNPSTGVHTATVPATISGRWHYKWATTSPTGVEYGYFDVAPNPPPRLDALATADDVEERLGRDLTDDEATRVAALLRDASSLVRGYTRQNFTLVEGDSVVLRPVGGRLTLPQRPVIAVTSVHAISGVKGGTDALMTGWRWDGLDVIEVGAVGWRMAIEYDLEPGDSYGDSYRVVYDHGYATTPDDVLGIVCGMVTRPLTSPTAVEGLASERIGQYGYQYAQFPGGQSPGITVRLTQADRDALDAAGYRRRTKTIQLRT